jgi:glycosyltransferase involved in cell wall biosynthesis
MKVALVHDYFNQNGGAEKVCETILTIYPEADVFTSVFNPLNFTTSTPITNSYNSGKVKTSFLNYFFIKNGKPTVWIKYFKHLYFVYPFAMCLMQVKNYDLVLISSTYSAKNIRLKNNKKIIHYCHSPARFLHGLVTEKDHSTLPFWQRAISFLIAPLLKMIDLGAVRNLVNQNTIWVSNSKFIQETVNNVYHVDSQIIYPPVEINKFAQVQRNPEPAEEFYLCHGRISFHKRLDLAIQACLTLNRRLYISGVSALENDMDNLKKLIPENKKELITFLGRTSDEQLSELVANAKAMIFPGKEDAGIAPIEMLAAGLPVIAYQSGGALEYVIDKVNGVFFEEQNLDSLIGKIMEFEALKLETTTIKSTVAKFSDKYFIEQIKKL